LSNGIIVSTNTDTNADLFWALKIAGSNFGIVTRFDMHTYSSPAIWGAVSVYSYSNPSGSNLFSDFTSYGHDNSGTYSFKAVVLVRDSGQDLISTVQVDLSGKPQPAMTSLSHNEMVGSTHDVINDVIAAVIASTARTHWYTLSTTVNTDFLQDMFNKGKEVFEPLDSRRNLSRSLGIHALQTSFIEKTAETPIYQALAILILGIDTRAYTLANRAYAYTGVQPNWLNLSWHLHC
jgi:hypothetical protein